MYRRDEGADKGRASATRLGGGEQLAADALDLLGSPARLFLADQLRQRLGALGRAHGLGMADVQRHYRHALLPQVRRPLQAARHHAVAAVFGATVAHQTDELDMGWDALTGASLQRRLAAVLGQAVEGHLL